MSEMESIDNMEDLEDRLKRLISENIKLQKDNAALKNQIELIYRSSRFKAGVRLMEIARNPLKIALIPYWAFKILAKKIDRKPRALRHEAASKFSITFPGFKVATVIDEISYSCFKYECDMYRVSRQGFRGEIDEFKPDMLFVESAWHGNAGQWEGAVSKADPDLFELVQHCKSKGIPTVFWCKEDPPQYETFKKAAALFDWVFTTDINCVPKYKADLGHGNVDVLMFAVQPKLQNPMQPKDGKLNSACFAGIYYKTKFFERQKLFEELADAAMEYGLDIYDRFSYVKNTDDYKYPDKYQSVLKPYVPYDDLVEVYKRYDVVINLNSVSDSDTMFSRRVFDAIACGVCVLSTPSTGMEKLFGDIVGVAHNKLEAEKFLMKVLSDSLYRDKLTARGYTIIVEKHTYAGRLMTIAQKIGKALPDSTVRKVSAVVVTMRPDYIDNVFDNFVKQTWPHKELIVVVNCDDADIGEYNRRVAQYPGEDIRVFRQAGSVPLGACLNFAFDKAKYDTLLKMDDDDYFGRDYLKDELVFFDFTDAGVIGKNAFYVYFDGSRKIALRYPGRENIYTGTVAGSAMLFKREVYAKARFDDTLNVSEIAAFLNLAIKKGFKVYSTHRFNHAVVRRELQGHTWREPEEEYMKKCELVEENAGPERLAELVDL
jgi:spore maturation protein CgeB